jgi:hypothetical protein
LEGLSIVQLSLTRGGEFWIDVEEPCLSELKKGDHANAFSLIRSLLAGYAACERYRFGCISNYLDISDADLLGDLSFWRAVSLAGQVANKPYAVLPRRWSELRRVLNGPANWMAVEAVADALLRSGHLVGCEVAEIAKFAISKANQ